MREPRNPSVGPHLQLDKPQVDIGGQRLRRARAGLTFAPFRNAYRLEERQKAKMPRILVLCDMHECDVHECK